MGCSASVPDTGTPDTLPDEDPPTSLRLMDVTVLNVSWKQKGAAYCIIECAGTRRITAREQVSNKVVWNASPFDFCLIGRDAQSVWDGTIIRFTFMARTPTGNDEEVGSVSLEVDRDWLQDTSGVTATQAIDLRGGGEGELEVLLEPLHALPAVAPGLDDQSAEITRLQRRTSKAVTSLSRADSVQTAGPGSPNPHTPNTAQSARPVYESSPARAARTLSAASLDQLSEMPVMTEELKEDLVESVRRQNNASSRLATLQAGTEGRTLSIAHATQLLETLRYDHEKKAAAIALMPKVIDRDRLYKLVDVVSSPKDKKSIAKRMRAIQGLA